jgi:hypothetical protein
MKRIIGSLAMLAMLAGFVATAPTPAEAQTDQSYWVGAVPKTALAGVGEALQCTVIAAGGAAQTVLWPLWGSTCYDITLTANLTLTLGSTVSPTGAAVPTPGYGQRIRFLIRNPTGGFTVTWPTGVKWNNGTAPTLATTAGTIYDYSVITSDGGTTLVMK